MYDIVFKCASCGIHLSASAEDAGYEFACPKCATPTAVPSGDVLFSCENCREKVLASSDTVGHTFECPHCQTPLIVPMADTQLEIHHQPTSLADVLPAEIVPESRNEGSMSNDLPSNEQEVLQNHHFMTTWGDYLAKAGLTSEDKEKKPKK